MHKFCACFCHVCLVGVVCESCKDLELRVSPDEVLTALQDAKEVLENIDDETEIEMDDEESESEDDQGRHIGKSSN